MLRLGLPTLDLMALQLLLLISIHYSFSKQNNLLVFQIPRGLQVLQLLMKFLVYYI